MVKRKIGDCGIMKYRILDNNKRVDEEYLRKLLFEYEIDDIWQNRDDYFDETYNLKSQFNMLEIAKHGDMEKVLYYLSTNWSIDVEELFKVGDKVKIPYVFDNCKFNDKVGTITELHDYNFYPNGDYSVVEIKTQATIEYENGETLPILDLYREPSGLVSKVIKVEE